jgi:hypothetical protein
MFDPEIVKKFTDYIKKNYKDKNVRDTHITVAGDPIPPAPVQIRTQTGQVQEWQHYHARRIQRY